MHEFSFSIFKFIGFLAELCGMLQLRRIINRTIVGFIVVGSANNYTPIKHSVSAGNLIHIVTVVIIGKPSLDLPIFIIYGTELNVFCLAACLSGTEKQ